MALSNGLEADASLTFLQGLLDALIYKEEVKPPKASKKKAPEAPPPENPTVVQMRRLALKCFYYLSLPLTLPLQCAVAGLPLFTVHLCSTASAIFQAITGGSSEHVQDGVYVLKLLVLVLRVNLPSAAIIAQSGLLTAFPAILAVLPLRLSLLQCIALLSKESIDTLAEDLVCVLEESNKALVELSAPPPEPAKGAAKAAPKKDDKKKGAPEVVEEVAPKLDQVVVDTKHGIIVSLKLLTCTLIAIAERKAITSEQVARIVAVIQAFSLNELVWAQLRRKLEPLDEVLHDLLERAAVLLGVLCEINDECRAVVIAGGGLSILQLLMMKSKKSSAMLPEGETEVTARNEEELLTATLSLRRFAEKAIFSLLAGPNQDEALPTRWTSCSAYSISAESLESMGTFFTYLGDLLDGNEAPVADTPAVDPKAKKGAPAPVVVAAPVEMGIYEADMGSRAARMLHAVLASCSKPDSLLNQPGCDKLTAKLSSFLSRVLIFEMNGCAAPAHVLDPLPALAVYHSTAVLEVFLSTAENIKIFAVKERLEVVAKALAFYGPTAKGIVEERSVTMLDPRHFEWTLTASPSTESHLVRPVLIDLLSGLASADGRLRVYEGPLPVEPCTALPKSTCPVEDCSLLTISVISDVCIGALLLPAVFLNTDGKLQCQLAEEPGLHVEVRDALLQLVSSIGSSHTVGLFACLEALGAAVVADSAQSAAGSLPLDSSAVTPWQRPQFFSDAFPEGSSAWATSSTLWPFLSVCGALMTVLADPRSSQQSLNFAIRALHAWTATAHFQAADHPVVWDVFTASFLLIGGGIALVGLLGRFGQLDDINKNEQIALLHRLLERGTLREKFWQEYMISHREEVILDPKTGKPIKKEVKKEKEAKKDPKAAVPVPSVVAEVAYNIESTEAFPDPNRGPSQSTWKALLDASFADARMHCSAITILIATVQGGLSVDFLLKQGVDINAVDEEGRTAMMYALLLDHGESIELLLTAQPDLDLVDHYGVPTINFAYFSLSSDAIPTAPLVSLVTDKALLTHAPVEAFGHPSAERLLDCQVDINVADADGHGPLLLAMGQGNLSVCLGGYRFAMRPAAFGAHIHEHIHALAAHGADIQACNKQGVTAWHLACAWGDVELVRYLLAKGAQVNALDSHHRHALHYLLACCPARCMELFDLLIEAALYRPLVQMEFVDFRTGRAALDKATVDMDRFLDSILGDAQQPVVLSQQRMLLPDLLGMCCAGAMPLFFMLLAGPDVLQELLFKEAIVGDKALRLQIALHFLDKAKSAGCLEAVASAIAEDGMTVLHATSLLCKGRTPQVPLTDKEKRSKRVKSFPSAELKLLDTLMPYSALYGICSTDLHGLCNWVPMQMAIIHGNEDLLDLLFMADREAFFHQKPVHFIASCASSIGDVAKMIVNCCRDAEQSRALLNDDPAPIHLAVLHEQPAVLSALCGCHKVDLNQRTEHTALTLACAAQKVELVQAMACAADRLDFAITGPPLRQASSLQQVTCVDVVLQARHLPLLSILTSMRRNDVIEQLLADKIQDEESSSWLMVLEKENASMAEQIRRLMPVINSGVAEEIVQEEEQGERPALVQEMQEETAELEEQEHERGQEEQEPEHELDREHELEQPEETIRFTIEANDEEQPEELADEEANPDPEPMPLDKAPAPLAPAETEDLPSLLVKLTVSNALLAFVIDLVNTSGIVTEDYHLNGEYFRGELPFFAMESDQAQGGNQESEISQ